MRLKFSFMVIATMLFSNMATSQEGLPIYTDYLTDNYYLIHPSMAGAQIVQSYALQLANNGLGKKMLQN